LYVEGEVRTVGGLLSELPVHLRESSASEAQRERAAQAAEQIRPAIGRGRESVYACFNMLTAYISAEAEATAYDARVRITAEKRKAPVWAQIERTWEGLSTNLAAVGEGLGTLDALLSSMDPESMLEYEQLLLRVQSLKRFATDTRVRIGHIIVGGEEALVTWVSHDRNKDQVQLASAPLSVAPLLESNLFAQKSTVVLTSATLSVANDFAYVRNRLGVPEPAEVMLDSPFDYEKQALVYIPTDLPEPNQPGYQRLFDETLIDLVKAAGGRTLVLFTSTNALRQTYRAIQDPLEAVGITVLGQGLDGSRRTVLERFKDAGGGSVLLGTTSFWEGVDVVGDALSVLVIARLPFSVPNDPVFAARSEGFRDSFSEYAVPQSILRFKQGFGRLVRSRGDRGVVAVFDKRVIAKKYGQLFLDSLPPTLVRTGPAKQLPGLVARFLATDSTHA
jgi:DNA polymerase-3 subunit epsilon/ATP-dependent DNA helicase DinG